jgi:hypothetical protein
MGSSPSFAMVIYSLLYVAVLMLLANRLFQLRDL